MPSSSITMKSFRRKAHCVAQRPSIAARWQRAQIFVGGEVSFGYPA